MLWLIRRFKERYALARSHGRNRRQFELDAAIRAQNPEAVDRALRDGVTLACCSLGSEGFYTPIELAVMYGNAEIIELLHRYENKTAKTPWKYNNE
jgi:hypothetical protein